MKKIIITSILFISFVNGFTQHDFYLGLQTDFGNVIGPKFESNRLQNRIASPYISGSVSLHYRFFDMFDLEGGIGQNWTNMRFRDPVFESENDGFDVKFSNKFYSWNYYAAISSYLRIERTKNYLYGKVGYSFNNYNAEDLTDSKDYIIAKNDIDKTFNANTVYSKSNNSIIPEIGYQRKIANRHLISTGIKWNMGQSNMFHGNYSITNNNDNSIVTDKISSKGDFLAINLRYDILLHHTPKKEKAKKKIKETKEVEIVDPLPVDQNQTINDRKIIVTNKVKVTTPKVTVQVWDHQMIDGDRISLNLNGDWVLQDYTLEKAKHTLEIELQQGTNLLVLHALNLGKYKPNTAAIIVNENGKLHQVILESDMNESGTLEIFYKQKK